MIKNYLKIAWRNILYNKVISAINIGGLALGMAISFMLLLYVQHEMSFDKFHKNTGRIYQVFKNQPFNGEVRTKSFTPQKLSAVLKKDFPEIEEVSRINESKDYLVQFNDKALKINTVAVDPSLLTIFTFDFIYGNQRNALNNSSDIVLSQAEAEALFGKINPVGKVIKFGNQFPLTVSGVIKDHQSNSSFTFKAMIPWDVFLTQQPWLKDESWANNSYFTYLLLKKGASVNALNKKIKGVIGQHFAEDKNIQLFVFPFDRLHLYGEFKNGKNVGGDIEYVRLFLFLAIGILLIACINFMNLSTARSQKRAREVGVRKAMGAQRLSLIKQFMGESLLLAIIALLIAILLTLSLLPFFENVLRVPLSIPYHNWRIWLAAFSITVFTGVLAGSYPALFLSSFNPVKVLKGPVAVAGTGVRPRQVLVVVQFTFAICLIISSVFIYKQIGYISGRPVGYNRTGLIEMPLDGAMFDNFETFRQEAIAARAITNGAVISEPIANLTSASWNNTWPGQLPGEKNIPIDCFAATYHFVDTYQLKILAGRDFATDRPSDSMGVILNQSAVNLMRLKDPVGQTINWMGANRTIIGVVANFVWGSPYAPVKPTIIGFVKGWVGNIGLRLNPNRPVSKSLTLLEALYRKYNPAYPFQYTFTDESFEKKFHSEQLLATMSVWFTILAILISCLGLFGLASFSAEQRRKEISIRKVLGAGTVHLWFKLSQEFIKLVLISFTIGSAISLYNVSKWLNTYAYHTSLNVTVFAATLLLSLMICLFAVSWQSLKAAWINPVKNLRNE